MSKFNLWRPVWAILLTAACVAAPATPAAPTAVPSLPPPKVSTATPAAPAPATVTPAPAVTELPPATPSPAPSPTAAVLNPLTGLALADAALLQRRPLAIKVAHFPRSVREHQVGLSGADNVWEHYAEGGVTRFTAIFFGQGPEKVGNVRSARLIDAILGDAYQAVLVASGSSTGTMNRLRENDDLYPRIVAEATGYAECPLLCREESAALTTNKLFTAPTELWRLAEAKGFGPATGLTGYAFGAAVPPAGTPLTTVHLDFQLNNTVAEWRYDAASGLYARWIDTAQLPTLAAHVDTLNGQALTAANVVVLYVTHVSSNIRETEGGTRYFSYDVQMTGEGLAYVFRDGQYWEVRWQRADAPHTLPRLVDAAGAPLPLKPGVTWFEVLSTTSPTQIDAAAGLFQARFKAPNPFPATPSP